MNDTIEATDLYAMVFSDDCKCESPTHDYGRVKCSGSVSAMLLSCTEPLKVCANMAARAKRLSDMGYACGFCREPIPTYWKVVAI